MSPNPGLGRDSAEVSSQQRGRAAARGREQSLQHPLGPLLGPRSTLRSGAGVEEQSTDWMTCKELRVPRGAKDSPHLGAPQGTQQGTWEARKASQRAQGFGSGFQCPLHLSQTSLSHLPSLSLRLITCRMEVISNLNHRGVFTQQIKKTRCRCTEQGPSDCADSPFDLGRLT